MIEVGSSAISFSESRWVLELLHWDMNVGSAMCPARRAIGPTHPIRRGWLPDHAEGTVALTGARSQVFGAS